MNTNNCVFENNRVAAQDADHIPGGGRSVCGIHILPTRQLDTSYRTTAFISVYSMHTCIWLACSAHEHTCLHIINLCVLQMK